MGGGNGGGAIVVYARKIAVAGTVTCSGSDGQDGGSRPGGGAGSGGGVKFVGAVMTLGEKLVNANSGLGGSSSGTSAGRPLRGGDGGIGGISLWYTDSLVGTTEPAVSASRFTLG